MGRMFSVVAGVGFLASQLFGGTLAVADDDPFTGCESGPVFGLNPGIRKICDGPIHADGTWLRSRKFMHPMFVHSTCGGIFYPSGDCPPWNNVRDTIPADLGVWEFFYITADTVPPGEPGHLDNPVRCTTNIWRCEIP